MRARWLRDEVIGRNGKPLPRVTWTITFDEKAIALVESSEPGAPTRAPKYRFDGSGESYTVRNTPGAFITRLVLRKARLIEVAETIVSTSGSALEISETWELTDSGNALKVVKKFKIRDNGGPTPKVAPFVKTIFRAQ